MISDIIYNICKPGETLHIDINMTNTGEVSWP